MVSKWVEVPLEQLKAQTKSAFAMGPFGSKIKAENFTTVGVPVIKGGNLNATYLDESDFDFLTQEKADELESAKARRLDIVITHRGTLGQVGLIPENSKYEEYVVSQSQLKMSFDIKRVDPYFVYYFLKSPLGQSRLLSNVSQVGVPAIAQALTSVRAIEIPIPENRSEQVRISSVLRSLDDKIDLNRHITQTLEAMAQAIFKSWFVDFDPVKAKIAAIEQGEDPLRAAMRAISGKTDAELDQMPREHYDQLAATAALFPDAMEESELGEIPKGWSISKIETLLSRLSAKTRYTKGQVSEYGQIPVFEQGASILLGYRNRDAYYQASSENPIFIFGDHTCVTRLSCQPFDISQNVIPLKGKNRATAWVYYAVKEKQKFQEYRRHWMELISKDVVVATADICLDFSKKVTNIHLQIEANERQKQSLRELRDSLLPKLLSGELQVPDIEHIAEEV